MLESMAPTSTAHAVLLPLIFLISAFCAAAYSPTAAIRFPLRRITSTAACEISGGGDNAADPGEKLAWLAAASVIRARHLKSHKAKGAAAAAAASAVPFTRVPLFPHSYGGYSLYLGFGTPEQKLPLVLDTGSELVWFPCTKSYQCRNCSSSVAPNATGSVPVFFPRSSSSARLVGCRNPKCAWIHTPEFLSRCRDCPLNGSDPDCSPVCPPYMLIYGSGSTGGLLLSESLRISPAAGAPFSNFIVGCSLFSSKLPPAGVAGFGRGPSSLPSQLGLARFSYCLVSRRYDDKAGESGSLMLGGPPKSSSDGFSFTPFLRNPSSSFPVSVYYYLGLRRITVDGKKVKMPSSALMPIPSGDGGTIIDSGTTFTYMDPKIFEPVARAVEERVAGRYNRSTAAEAQTGLRPCFTPASAAEKVILPELAFHFKGGAEMRLPLANYFAVVGSSATVCLTIVTDAAGAGEDGGPSVILGSFQQQNYHIVYDLERERLGFRQQPCLETPRP